GTAKTLNAVSFADAGHGWAAGAVGTILGTVNGGTTGVEPLPDLALPERFVLEQNYPNPFNPATSIRFQLSDAETVSLTVYNALGQQVATLAQGRYAAGTYQVTWQAEHAASGVYFYRLQAGNQVQIRKMTLLR
ncbi:MAG: T9SS type A sorting domain-containing protein, partial [Calditrichaeota bacterium]|nr:T9SS type A sorting domain-containing protein [Calditrichota bacterium]